MVYMFIWSLKPASKANTGFNTYRVGSQDRRQQNAAWHITYQRDVLIAFSWLRLCDTEHFKTSEPQLSTVP